MTTFPFLCFFPSCQQIQYHSFCSFFLAESWITLSACKLVIHKRQDHSYLLLTLSFVQPLLLALVTNSVHPPPSCVISQNTLTVSAEFGFCKKMVYKPSVLLLQRSANSRHERIGTKNKNKKEKKELLLLCLKVPLWYKLSYN